MILSELQNVRQYVVLTAVPFVHWCSAAEPTVPHVCLFVVQNQLSFGGYKYIYAWIWTRRATHPWKGTFWQTTLNSVMKADVTRGHSGTCDRCVCSTCQACRSEGRVFPTLSCDHHWSSFSVMFFIIVCVPIPICVPGSWHDSLLCHPAYSTLQRVIKTDYSKDRARTGSEESNATKACTLNCVTFLDWSRKFCFLFLFLPQGSRFRIKMHRVMNRPILFIIRLAQTENPLRPLNNTNVFPRLSEVHFLPCLCLKLPDGVRELEQRPGVGMGGVYHAKGARPHKRTTIEEGELHNPNNSWTKICGKKKKKKKRKIVI